MAEKKKVVIGFLGTKLDAVRHEQRWNRWRPSVALFGHDWFAPSSLELLVTKEEQRALASTVAADIQSIAPTAQVQTHLLAVTDPWDFVQVYSALLDFSKSYDFREDCEYFVHLTTGTHVAQICLFLLVEARYLPAKLIETFTHGHEGGDAWRGRLGVIDLNLSTYDLLAKRFQEESRSSQDLLKGGIATKNAAFNKLIEKVERVALNSPAPLLLCGPTGAGKSQLASRIFELRAKRHLVEGAFVEVNCATLRGDNAMSTLFGHKKGAFTGAVSDRAGLLKSANKGVLFLDEIGELGLDEQAMLLRALEDKRFTPMGSDKEVQSDFLLLAGTNKDLQAAVKAGEFRADLLARINVWQFELPGLAARKEDIEPNLDHELTRVGQQCGLRLSMTTAARKAYLDFAQDAPWLGNFRDLGASVSRMATLCDRGRIGEDDVRDECETLSRTWNEGAARGPKSLVSLVLSSAQLQAMDVFDVAGLEVALQTIADTSSMAEAGRKLFAASRMEKSNPNDSDRLRKLLTRAGLDYRTVKEVLS